MAAMVLCGVDWQQWSWRGDSVATSDAADALTPAALTNAFGESVSGERAVYDWNGAWLYRTTPPSVSPPPPPTIALPAPEKGQRLEFEFRYQPDLITAKWIVEGQI
jgi:hypothetical protein